MDFRSRNADWEPANALAEVHRYTGRHTAQSYLMGSCDPGDRQGVPGSASRLTMKQMHHAILGCGSLPPKLCAGHWG